MFIEFVSPHSVNAKKQKLFRILKLEKFSEKLYENNIKPNHITIISLIFGFLSVGYVYNNHLLFVIFYITNRLLDIFDGYYAREIGRDSKSGNYLDHGGDILINVLFLLKSILFIDGYLPIIALFIFVTELLLLTKLSHLDKKLPSGVFVLFYLFGEYTLGLRFQILYQITTFLLLLI